MHVKEECGLHVTDSSSCMKTFSASLVDSWVCKGRLAVRLLPARLLVQKSPLHCTTRNGCLARVGADSKMSAAAGRGRGRGIADNAVSNALAGLGALGSIAGASGPAMKGSQGQRGQRNAGQQPNGSDMDLATSENRPSTADSRRGQGRSQKRDQGPQHPLQGGDAPGPGPSSGYSRPSSARPQSGSSKGVSQDSQPAEQRPQKQQKQQPQQQQNYSPPEYVAPRQVPTALQHQSNTRFQVSPAKQQSGLDAALQQGLEAQRRSTA